MLLYFIAIISSQLLILSFFFYIFCPVDLTADCTKQLCTLEKTKDKGKASLIPKEKEGVNEGDEGPSVEVKEEESKESAEVDSSKETPISLVELVDSKPPGDKYSPKVRLKAFLA